MVRINDLIAGVARSFAKAGAIVALSITTVGVGSSCLASNSLEPLSAGGIHVLFVGNSLTYVNDMPGMVAVLGTLAGDTIRVATSAEPDLAIIDHWNGQSNARAQIALRGWNYVILQQGPSTLQLSRDTLVLGAQLFAPSIRAAGAKPALLMVWPSSDRLAFFDDVRTSYQQAATAVGGMFIPAGEAWRRAWAVDSSFQFFGGDGYHPSPVGTLAAALVVFERVTGRDARILPVASLQAQFRVGLSDAQVRELLSAVHDANSAYP